MGIIVNQSIRNAFISYTGIVLGFISTILLFPNILGAEKFGLTRSLIAIMVIVVQLVSLGLPNSIIKFFPFLSEKTRHSQGLYWLFLIPPTFALIIFSIIYVFLDDFILDIYKDSTLIAEYYYYVIPMVAFSTIFGLLNSFIKASFNTVFASFLQDILLRVVVIVALILFYFEFISFDQFLILFVGNYLLQYLILLFYSIRKGLITFNPQPSTFDYQTRKRIQNYSFYSFFSGFTMILIGNIDLLMVDIFKGLEETGIYAIALYVGAVITIPKKSIAKILFPIISLSFQKNDQENIQAVYKQSSLNMILFGLLIYIGVIANMDNLYTMLPDTFSSGSIVIIIIGLANLFDMITGANGQIIISSKYYKFDFIASFVLMISAVVLNLILIPQHGIVGAAIATASSIFIFNFIKVIYVWRKFKIHPFTKNTLGVIILGITVLYLSTLLPQIKNIYIDIPVRSFLMALVYLSCIWTFKLSDEVNDLMRSFFLKIKS
ncbi:MAG: polysaccharide biosynthesis C-terminal domain-containing protein [Balneola sp.]